MKTQPPSDSSQSGWMAFNRPDAVGIALSMAVPLVAVLVGNGIIFGLGFQGRSPRVTTLALAPPPWAIGLIWCVIYPMWGLARWKAWQLGEQGRVAAWWVAALMLWGLLYPVITMGFHLGVGAVASFVSLLLVGFTTWEIWRASSRLIWLLLPSAVWIFFANILGVAALLNR